MIQAPLARLLRIDDQQRVTTVSGMLERHHKESASYWAQLVLSVGIATFGLVLNSGAVIIGAMLIAPLMGPIVELAMGLAVGSSLLVLRSAARISVSVFVAVVAAGVLVRTLPFQEITAEVAARTSPTVLDLMVATFCALTAAFVTLKPHDSVGTAAGTSISISLVPPLCAAGFGLGIGAPKVTRGALLLFTANLSAILLFALIAFLLAGFGKVRAEEIENKVIGEIERKGALVRVASRLNSLFGSRHATIFKLVLPVGLVGAVFAPLQQALKTVSAEVRARKQISAILDEREELKSAITTSIDFDDGGLVVRLVIVGDPSQAKAVEDDLRARAVSEIGSNVVVSVVGVPDGAYVARLAAAARATAPLAPPAAPPPKPVLPLAELNQRVTVALKDRYPEKEAGPLIVWTLRGDREPPVLRLTHLGPPLGPAATRLLAEVLAEPLHGPVEIDDDALSPALRPEANGAALALAVTVARARLRGLEGLRVCAEIPPPPRGTAPGRPGSIEAAPTLLGMEAEDIRVGETWSLRFSNAACAPPAVAP